MLHSRPIAGLAVAVVVVSGGLASVATGASATTVKAHTPKCFGKTATIVVTGKNKTVRAPKGKLHKAGSVIVALGKGDKVYGGDGNDKICVGDAKSVNAGKGDDNVQFTTGTIHGNDGNDLLQQTGKGNATVYGDAGNDKIKLAKGNSTANGGDGNDSLSAGASGNQKLSGNAGKDNFYAGGATATLDGGADDDSYTVSGVSAPHTFVVPGTGDKVNGKYVRVDASKDTSNSVLSFNGYGAPTAFGQTQLPGDVLSGQGGSLDISNAIAPVGRRLTAWSINFGDGSPLLAGHGAPPSSTDHSYITEGAHLITVTVTDSVGKSIVRTIVVYTAKAPTASITSTVTGATATFALATAADPGVAAISAFSLDFGDGSDVYSGAGAPAATFNHAYIPGTYTATLTVVDDHGSQVTKTTQVTIANTGVGNPYAAIQLTKSIDFSGSDTRSNSNVTVGGGAAHTVELGQPLNYYADGQPSADPGDDFSLQSETIDLGDGRGAKTIFNYTTPPTSSDALADANDQVAYKTPGVKTITFTVTESGYDGNGNALPPRTATTQTQVNVLAGVTTAQLSSFSGTEGAFTAYTAGTAPAPGTSISFYELTGPDGADLYGVGAPPAALSQAVTPVSGEFFLTVRDSLGYATEARSEGIVTADHPVAGDPSFAEESGWSGQTVGVGPDDTTTGGFVQAALVPSFGSRITGTLINYGDGSTVANAPGSLGGALISPTAHVFRAPGDYTVTTSLTDSAKKSDSSTVTVSVAGRPTLALAGPATAAANAPVTVTTAPAYGANAAAEAWRVDYGDGTPPAGGYGAVPPAVTHAYAQSGSYDIEVTIVNDHGGSTSTIKTVTVPDAA